MSRPGDFGRYSDGTQNDEFCRHCFEDGKFTEPDMTLDRMIEKCIAIMKSMDVPETQIEQTKAFIPMLKRWRSR
jgi:hypothetical protein